MEFSINIVTVKLVLKSCLLSVCAVWHCLQTGGGVHSVSKEITAVPSLFIGDPWAESESETDIRMLVSFPPVSHLSSDSIPDRGRATTGRLIFSTRFYFDSTQGAGFTAATPVLYKRDQTTKMVTFGTFSQPPFWAIFLAFQDSLFKRVWDFSWTDPPLWCPVFDGFPNSSTLSLSYWLPSPHKGFGAATWLFCIFSHKQNLSRLIYFSVIGPESRKVFNHYHLSI